MHSGKFQGVESQNARVDLTTSSTKIGKGTNYASKVGKKPEGSRFIPSRPKCEPRHVCLFVCRSRSVFL